MLAGIMANQNQNKPDSDAAAPSKPGAPADARRETHPDRTADDRKPGGAGGGAADRRTGVVTDPDAAGEDDLGPSRTSKPARE
jgi:hypothetical protein